MFLFSALSDEDIDVGALLKSWLKGQPEECRSNLENWLGDYFQRGLDWVLKQVNCFNELNLRNTVLYSAGLDEHP